MTDSLKYFASAIALALLAIVTVMWSWNTISGLFDGPLMQAKHAVAGLLLLVLARTICRRGSPRHRHRGALGHEN